MIYNQCPSQDSSYSSILIISGCDASEFLNGQLSVRLPNAKNGRYTLLLNNAGRIVSDGFILCYNDTHYLLCIDSRRLCAVSQHLLKFMINYKVVISKASTLYCGTAQHIENKQEHNIWTIIDPRYTKIGYRIISDSPLPSDHGYLQRRLNVGLPETPDLPENKAMPIEYGLDQLAIDQDKGCFNGQEVIVRLLHQGKSKFLVIPVCIADYSTKNKLLPGLKLMIKGKIVATVISVYAQWAFIRIAVDYIDSIEKLTFDVKLSNKDCKYNARSKTIRLIDGRSVQQSWRQFNYN